MLAVIENYWVTILKALGHPTRLQIVIELLKGTKCVTDIHDLLPASQANISPNTSPCYAMPGLLTLPRTDHSVATMSVALNWLKGSWLCCVMSSRKVKDQKCNAACAVQKTGKITEPMSPKEGLCHET
jgi:DNA-binding transcriptional ArsR family regulator